MNGPFETELLVRVEEAGINASAPREQREAGDAGCGDDAAGRGQAEGMRSCVEVTPGGSAFRARGLLGWVAADAPHATQVDAHAAVASSEPGHTVTAASNRQV